MDYLVKTARKVKEENKAMLAKVLPMCSTENLVHVVQEASPEKLGNQELLVLLDLMVSPGLLVKKVSEASQVIRAELEDQAPMVEEENKLLQVLKA